MLRKSYLANKKIDLLNNIGMRGIFACFMPTNLKMCYSSDTFSHTLKWTAYIQMKNTIKEKLPPDLNLKVSYLWFLWFDIHISSWVWRDRWHFSCFIFIFSTYSSFDSKHAETQARCWLGFVGDWCAAQFFKDHRFWSLQSERRWWMFHTRDWSSNEETDLVSWTCSGDIRWVIM